MEVSYTVSVLVVVAPPTFNVASVVIPVTLKFFVETIPVKYPSLAKSSS